MNKFLAKEKLQDKVEISEEVYFKIHSSIASPAKVTKEEVYKFLQTLLDKESKRDYAISCALAFAGGRISEVLSLRFQEVDFEGNKISFRGKGNKVRTLSMGTRLRSALKQYIDLERDKTSMCEYIFLSYKGSKLDRSQVNRIFNRHSTVITPHQLRHFFCSYLIEEQKMELSLVANLAGHASVKTTLIYTNPTEKRLKEAMDSF